MLLRRPPMLLVACLGLATAALIACGGNDGSDADDDGAGATATAPASAPAGQGPTGGGAGVTPAPPGSFAGNEPPVTTATANGQSVQTGIGTFCWTALCVDKIGVPTLGSLPVSRGDTVSVAIPGATPPFREAIASAFPAVNPMRLDDGSDIWPYPGSTGSELPAAVTANTVEVTVDLAPGRYVLAVSMFFEGGDVVYGVLLEVQ